METILGVVISAIVGALITYFFTSRKKLMIILNTKSFSFKEYGVTDLKLTYKDKVIYDFCVTNMIIRNCGNKTIDGGDIAKSDKLSIKLPGSFSSYKIVEQNKANNVSIEKDNANVFYINFDYLDKGDHISITFFHDHAKIKPNIFGKIKGCRLILASSRHPYLNSIINIIMITLALGFSVFGILGLVRNEKELITVIAFSILLLVFIAFCSFGLYINIKELVNTYRINGKLNKKSK